MIKIKNINDSKKSKSNFERLIRDKKASGDQLISLWLFLILGMVVGGITIAMMIFYSSPFDTRLIESEFLFNELSSCISDNGNLKEEVLKKDFNVYSECNINKEVFKRGNNDDEINYYLEMSIYDPNKEEGDKKVRETIFLGDVGKRKDCLIYLDLKPKKYTRCFYGNISLNYYNNTRRAIQDLRVEIMAASNVKGKGAKENV